MAKVVITNARLSYVHVWEPKAMEGSNNDPKYSVSIIIPKSDTKNINAVKKAIAEAQEEYKGKCFGGKIPPNLKSPLRDGDTDRPDDPVYANSYFINASSKSKPGVLTPSKKIMTNETELYSGCYAHVSINMYGYNTSGNRGIAAGLNNIMKTHDGDALGGGASAESDFAEFEEVVEDVGDDF